MGDGAAGGNLLENLFRLPPFGGEVERVRLENYRVVACHAMVCRVVATVTQVNTSCRYIASLVHLVVSLDGEGRLLVVVRVMAVVEKVRACK